MVTGILTMVVVWCLFYGRLPAAVLLLLGGGLGAALSLLGRHGSGQFLTIDILAQTSRLNRVSPLLKFWTALILMALCVSASSSFVGLFLTVFMLILIVCGGGLALHDYIHLLALPLSFLLLGGLALLFEVTVQRTGVLGIPVFGFWLCVSQAAQTRAMLVMAGALGSLSCLYMLSLTTPMSDLIGVLRRIHCPELLIDLMYLIYRYIFILLSMYHAMRDAAASRLGFGDYRTSLRTTGNLYFSLLFRSYRQANRNFDAMESRCFDSGIRFLEDAGKIRGSHVLAAGALILLTLGLSIFFW